MTSAVYSAMSVVELKELLREKGLTVSGKKADLIQRLEDDEFGVTTKDGPDPESDDFTASLLIPYEVEAAARDKVSEIVSESETIVITTDEENQLAAEFLTTKVKRALKGLDSAFDPIVKSWHQGHKQTLATKKKLAAPLLEVERNVKSAIASYHEAQRFIQEEERRELERTMRDEAEAEIVAMAADLMEAGDVEAGEALLATLEDEVEPVSVPATFVKPRAEGVQVSRVMKWKFISRHEMKREYMMPDNVKINKVVREMGFDAAEEVGGIEVYEENRVAASAR